MNENFFSIHVSHRWHCILVKINVSHSLYFILVLFFSLNFGRKPGGMVQLTVLIYVESCLFEVSNYCLINPDQNDRSIDYHVAVYRLFLRNRFHKGSMGNYVL